MSDVTLTQPRPGVTVLTLDRPERLNALSASLVDELHDVLDATGVDQACRVLVITGAGDAFQPAMGTDSMRGPYVDRAAVTSCAAALSTGSRAESMARCSRCHGR